MPPPSAAAARLATHWAVDALAGDETLDFSAIKALAGLWPESHAGGPAATWERVALRCLQEVVAVSAEVEVAPGVAGAGGKRLRVDPTLSFEEFLLELIGQVHSSGSLEKDMLPSFSEDLQKFICIKTLTLPETSFELLREVDPEVTPPSPVEKSGEGCPRDNPDLQQENLTVFVNETDTRDVQKDPMVHIADLNEPSTLYSRCYVQPQENTIGAVGVSVQSAEKSLIVDDRNMSIAAEPPASAASSDALLRSNTELLSKKDVVETTLSQEKSTTTNLQPGDKYQNPSHNNDGERPHNDGTNIQSSKDFSHQGLTMQAMVAPDLERSTDALLTCTSEKSHLSEFLAADDTAMIGQPLGRKTRNSRQHDRGEKASQDLDEGSARIQLVEKDPGHNEPNLQNAGVLPSVSCYVVVQEDKSETNRPQEDATDHSKMYEQKNGDKANLEVSSADKANPALQGDGSILKKNASCGGQTAIDSPCRNVTLHNRSSEVDSLSEKNTEKNMSDIPVPNSPKDGNKEGTKRAANKKITGNAVVETSNMHCSGDGSSGFAAACLLSLIGNMPSSTQDSDANGSIEGLTEQDLCVKCGKDGQLLKCSSCSLAAHDSCFGSSVTFDVSGQLYCPVCLYTKATEAYKNAKTAYSEAKKNLSAFLGTKQFAKQDDEQSTGKEPAATSSKYHFNEGNTYKRQGNNLSETGNLSHKDEEPGQCRNKQRTNDTSDACTEEDQLNGTKQFAKQHDEQCTGKQPAATRSRYHLNEGNTSKRQGDNPSEADHLSHKDGEPGQWRKKQRTNDTSGACPEEEQLNGCNASKRQGKDQSEADNLCHKDEEPGQQRKKQRKNDTTDAFPEEDQLNGCDTSIRQGNHQSGNLSHNKDLESGQHKTNATTATYTEELITEKEPFDLNSGIATNKDCALHYKRRHIHIADHGQPVENTKAREDGNANSFYEAQHSSQSRSSPVTSQNAEVDKHDGPTNSHEFENSDEIEATSSNDSDSRSSPPWRNMRHHKARLQQKQTVVSNNFKKALGCQDEHMPSPSKKRKCVPKRYSNPLAPAGRRSKLRWTEEEEETLRDAMLKFTPKDDGLIPWVRILEYGRDVFDKTRLPSDLRVKWRNMKKRS